MARSAKRPVNGILLLDKPSGMSSNQALQRVKWLYQARKAGHTGSLDPLATGLLPICFGEATKVSAFLLDADKRYRVTARFGRTTTTGDSEGEPLDEYPLPELSRERVEPVLSTFVGEIEQVPPMYSALKHQGERLYKLARQGIEVERPPRAVTIYSLDLIALRAAELELEVRCSKGTYVRTLVEDIARALGSGAHVAALRRTGLGPFTGETMVSLDEVLEWSDEGYQRLDAALRPIDLALQHWPEVQLSVEMAAYVRQGQPVWVPKAPAAGWVRLYDAEHQLVAMGQMQDDGRIAPKRVLAQG